LSLSSVFSLVDSVVDVVGVVVGCGGVVVGGAEVGRVVVVVVVEVGEVSLARRGSGFDFELALVSESSSVELSVGDVDETILVGIWGNARFIFFGFGFLRLSLLARPTLGRSNDRCWNSLLSNRASSSSGVSCSFFFWWHSDST